MPTRSSLLTTIVFVALVAVGCSSTDGDSVASGDSTTTLVEAVSDTPVSVAPADDTTSTTAEPTEPSTSTTTEVDTPSTCDAPVDVAYYVDVALDDPDGGLNMRVAAGVDNDIVAVIPRNEALVTTGRCQTLGTIDWWEVTTPDADSTGWVSSRFLSDQLVFNPGLGKAVVDTDNVGTSGETLDEIAAQIAEAYGFDEDVDIVMIGEPEGADAIGGSVIYEMTGLKDDASNGYRVEIDFLFDKNEDEGGEVVGYTAAAITNYSLCMRRVTESGLCL